MSTKKAKPVTKEPEVVADTPPAPTADPVTTPAERPVQAVWRVCAEMLTANPETKRSEVIAACVAIGINKHTAATQLQRYRTAQKAKA